MTELSTETSLPAILAGRYRVIRPLGSGGMGWVLLASDNELNGQEVAVKLLYPQLVGSATSQERFRREVLIARRLIHPHIVRTYNFHSDGQQHFLTMEYVDGGSLADTLGRSATSRGLEIEECIEVLLSIADGLAYAHHLGVVHLDLKPENILRASDGAAKIADFGIAQLLRRADTGDEGPAIGTPAYMAPEQFRGEGATVRTDIYSFGILAFELLSGSAPFAAATPFLLAMKHLNEPLPFERLEQRGLPEWAFELLRCCTAKDPNARFGSGVELRQFLGKQTGTPAAQLSAPSFPASNTAPRPRVSRYRAMRTRFRALPLYQRIGVRIVIYSVLWGIFLKVVNEQPDLRRWTHAAVYKMERSQGKDLLKLRLLFGIRSTFHNKADHFISAQNNSDEMYGLLKAGIDPNEKDPQGDHLMLHTIRSFNERGLRYLLESGADPNLASAQGETGLYTAVLQNNEPAFAMLLSHGADPNLMSRNTSLLTFAVRNNNERFFDLLVSHGADPQRPENRLLLFDAIASRSAALVTKVLGYGFDPNRIAAETGHSAMTEAEQCSDCSAVRAVLKEWEVRREGRE